jgi:hypothetical protein
MIVRYSTAGAFALAAQVLSACSLFAPSIADYAREKPAGGAGGIAGSGGIAELGGAGAGGSALGGQSSSCLGGSGCSVGGMGGAGAAGAGGEGCTTCAPPDLAIGAITWSPATPTAGKAVTFSATIWNHGATATPQGTVHRVRFDVDGSEVNWSDDHTAAIPPGGSAILAATGSPSHASTWTAISGSHKVRAWVDDLSLIPESDETNNQTTTNLDIAAIPNLLLGYSFDDSASGILDFSGNRRTGNGSASGVSFGPGKAGTAVQLDGSGGYLMVPANTLDAVADFTIACWVEQGSLRSNSRVFDFEDSTDTHILLNTNESSAQKLTFESSLVGGSWNFVRAAPLPIGSWQHVAVARAGASISVYLNGSWVATGPMGAGTLPGSAASASNWIGRSHWADPYLDGAIDDFRIYNRALGNAEIASLAAGP